MHDGWIHLIGNLVFLWAFGIVVEGKVGWLVFSAIYLAVGTIYGFILQMGTVIVGMDEGMALGASAAIFGLLAICVAWAPANEFETVWFFGFYAIYRKSASYLWSILLRQGVRISRLARVQHEFGTASYHGLSDRLASRAMDGQSGAC